jgi:hypothetical protein
MPTYWVEFEYNMEEDSQNVEGAPVQFLGYVARDLSVTFFGSIVPSPYYGTNWMQASLPYTDAIEGSWELGPNGYSFVETGEIVFNYTITIGNSYVVGTEPNPTTLIGPTSTASVPNMSGVLPTQPPGVLTVTWTDWAWAEISVPNAPLFTTGADSVNFNSLTPSQQQAVNAGADTTHGLGGNDNVTLYSSGSQTFNTDSTSSDNNYRVTGTGGSYTINEGAGTEFITINGNGQNTIDAGSGSDTISISGNGNNKIFCTTGSDTIVINGSGANTIHLGTATATITLSGSNNNIDFDGHAGTANLFLQKGFQENINGFTSGDFIDLLNVGNATFSAALTSTGVLNPGEVDLYQNGSKIGSLFFDASVDYTQLKPISDGTGGTEIVLDSAPGPQDPSGNKIVWSFVHWFEGGSQLAPYIPPGALSGLTMAEGVDIGNFGNVSSPTTNQISQLLSSWKNDPNIAFVSSFLGSTIY